jgi:hypothetical protein
LRLVYGAERRDGENAVFTAPNVAALLTAPNVAVGGVEAWNGAEIAVALKQKIPGEEIERSDVRGEKRQSLSVRYV